MSDAAERVLAFELGGVSWALPLADVREVADIGALWAIPAVPGALAGVANHRGDALPVVAATALLELSEERVPPARQLLVIGGSGDEPGRLGLPVERVLGLADAPLGQRPRGGVVRARGTLEGRMLRVLDVERILQRAEQVILEAEQRP
jgi:purine-binding chemotaxis protein CheW